MKTKWFIKNCLPYLLIALLISCVCAFKPLSHKKVELDYQEAKVALPDGQIYSTHIASNDHQIYIPYDLVEHMINEPISWDASNHLLSVGNIPAANVMSDKLKIYHYDYDAVRAFLYCPDAKTNKPMTMANETHDYGYSFTNVFSACFNLNQTYHHISGYLGCEDFKASNGQVDFYLDDVLIASETIKADSLPKPIELNVDKGTQLKLVFSQFKPDTQIDFVDVFID